MSQIQLKRGKAWQDMLREYRVLVDGKHVASIGEKSEVTVPITPGKHVVQLSVDWCTSPKVEVTVEQGQTLPMGCGPNSNALLALLYITLWRKKYIWLRQLPVNA